MMIQHILIFLCSVIVLLALRGSIFLIQDMLWYRKKETEESKRKQKKEEPFLI